MVNFNGQLLSDLVIPYTNRAFRYADGLFETIKVVNNRLVFFEDHYFRLMASMRMLRMEIPMHFTYEFVEGEIAKTIAFLAFDAPPFMTGCIIDVNGASYLRS